MCSTRPWYLAVPRSRAHPAAKNRPPPCTVPPCRPPRPSWRPFLRPPRTPIYILPNAWRQTRLTQRVCVRRGRLCHGRRRARVAFNRLRPCLAGAAGSRSLYRRRDPSHDSSSAFVTHRVSPLVSTMRQPGSTRPTRRPVNSITTRSLFSPVSLLMQLLAASVPSLSGVAFRSAGSCCRSIGGGGA